MTTFVLNAPQIPGLALGSFRGEPDYPAIVDINNASWPIDDRFDVDTLENCRLTFASIVDFDAPHDTLIAEIFGVPVAYVVVSRSEDVDGQGKPEHRLYLEGTVKPHWRRKGIGRAMQEWLESRATEIFEAMPQVGQVKLTSFIRDKNVGCAILLRQSAFQPTHFWIGMEQSLADEKPEYLLPEGLTVRPVREGDFVIILKAQKAAFWDKLGKPSEVTESEVRDFMNFATDQMNQYELWQVAWDGNEVAGMVLNNIDIRGNKQLGLNRGFTDPICVAHKWRRRGVAKALISRSLNVLRRAGVATAFLGVDTHNPNNALRLYESLGFVKVKSGTTYQKLLCK